jgi:hypothetical protein
MSCAPKGDTQYNTGGQTWGFGAALVTAEPVEGGDAEFLDPARFGLGAH